MSRGWLILGLLLNIAIAVSVAHSQPAPSASDQPTIQLAPASVAPGSPGLPGDAGARSASPVIAPDLFSGAAGLTVPIAVPPARAGVAPTVELRYRSNSGPGVLGVGWTLEFGRIELDAERAPSVEPQARRFRYVTSSGAVLIEPNGRLREGNARLNFSFEDGHWVMRDGQGGRYDFGVTADGRLTVGTEVIDYFLERYTDRFGNTRALTYERDGNLPRVRCIEYGANSGLGIAATARIDVAYEARPDKVRRYHRGEDLSLSGRLKSIRSATGSGCGGTSGTAHAHYELIYELSESTARSMLSQIQRLGPDGATNYPALKFSYASRGGDIWEPMIGQSLPPHLGLLGDNCIAADINGNGEAEVSCLSGPDQWSVGFKRFDEMRRPSLIGARIPANQVGRVCSATDFNADGRQDMLCYHDGGWVAAESNGRGWVRSDRFTPDFVNHENCLQGDVNGDGTGDLVCWFENRLDWFGAYESGWRRQGRLVSDAIDNIGEADLRRRCLGGRFTAARAFAVACHLGNGRWVVGSLEESWVTSGGPAPAAPLGRTCLSGDLTGDGYTDLACTSGGREWQVAVWTGAAWRMETWANGPNARLDLVEYCTIVDINGDGVDDIACKQGGAGAVFEVGRSTGAGWKVATSNLQSNAPAPIRRHCLFGDFGGEGNTGIRCERLVADSRRADDTLVEFTNATGGRTEFRYAPAAASWDLGAALNLPVGPLLVVKDVTTSDGVGPASRTTYGFEHGYFDPGTREFRGFGKVTLYQPGYLTGLGSKQEFWFLQGDSPDPSASVKGGLGAMRGKVYRSRITRRDGGADRVVSQTDVTYWDEPTLGFHPIKSTAVSRCELGPCRAVSRFEYAWDKYGNLLREAVIDPVAGQFDSVTIRNFLVRPDLDLVSLPLDETVFDPKRAEPLERTVYEYAEPLACLTPRKLATTPTVTAIIREIDAHRSVRTRFAYDAFGNLACKQGPTSDRIVDLTWDSTATFLVRSATTIADGRTLAWSFEHWGVTAGATAPGAYGRLKAVVDPNASAATPTSAYTYDALGRLTSVAIGGSPPSLFRYLDIGDPLKQRVRVEGPTGVFTETYFSGFGLPMRERVSAPDGKVVRRDYRYDARGLLTEVAAPTFDGQTPAGAYALHYDGAGRLTRFIKPDQTFDYQCDSDLTTVVGDSRGVRRRHIRDGRGRITGIEEYDLQSVSCDDTLAPVYARTSFKYDAAGRLVELVDGNGVARRATYNRLGQPLEITDPYTGAIKLTYDGSGRVATREDAEGRVLAFRYDDAGRVREKRAGRRTVATFTYDRPSENALGRLAEVDDDSGSTSYGYDLVGRTTQAEKRVGGRRFVLEYGYDDAGRIARLTYPDGQAVTYQYDAAELAEVRLGATALVRFSQFDPWSRPLRTEFGNGVRETRSYGALSITGCTDFERLCRLVVGSDAGPGVLARTWRYDASGNRVQTLDENGAAASYAYDGMNRIRRFSQGSTSREWTYDRVGNMSSDSAFGAYEYPPITSALPYATTRIGQVATRYDRSGQLLALTPSRPSQSHLQATYGYDAEGRLNSASTPLGDITVSYDAEGRRVATSGDGESRRMGDAWICLGGSCTGRVFAGRSVVAEFGPNVRYRTADALGSTLATTGPGGAVAARYDYTPFGADLPGSTARATISTGFIGEPYHRMLRLYEFGARWYHADIGRFLTPDSADSASLNPQDFNRLAYASNRPTVLRDPTGFFGEDEEGGGNPTGENRMEMPGREEKPDHDPPERREREFNSERPDRGTARDEERRAPEPPPQPGTDIGGGQFGAGRSGSSGGASGKPRGTPVSETALPHIGSGIVSATLGYGTITAVATGAVCLTPVGQVALLVVGTMSLAGGIAEVTVGATQGLMALTAPEGQMPTEAAGTATALMIGSSPGAAVGAAIGAIADGQNGMAVGVAMGFGIETIASGRLATPNATSLFSVYALEGYAKDYLERAGSDRSPMP